MKNLKHFDSLNEEAENRIILDALDFANLVNGKEVVTTGTRGPVKIILSDIGFDKMEDILWNATTNLKLKK